MKPHSTHPSTVANYHNHFQAGSTLLEVLIAIVIFIVGMLALVHLQGNVTKSSADANMRTVASNIAEEIIEDARNFQKITTTSGFKAYDDIVSETRTINRGGVDYAVVTTVQPYLFAANKVDVTKVANTVPSDFKHLRITVAWGAGQLFKIDGTQANQALGNKVFRASTVIPRILELNNAKVAAEDNEALGYPPVNYTPGLNPDIVAISLGDQKFKESTTPEPTVIRRDELVETWFDVITYTNNGADATFLRREEFASISCKCTLKAASGSGKDGRQPTRWNGVEYDEEPLVAKQYGVSASNQQSQYCDVCCNDHHDTGSGSGSYRPQASSFTGNHKHYNLDNRGVLTEASVGQDYIEACRLIRKDGFFRVAQDFNLESQTAFPEDYLDDGSEVTAYSTYVTDAVEDHFGGSSWPAHTLPFDGRDAAHPSALPTLTIPFSESQQLRSRGIYTDVVSPALQSNLDHCFDNNGVPTPDDPNCYAKTASSPLELYPFFDVQLTLLSRWTDLNNGDPVVVTNQELETANTHSRGVASLAQSKVGLATTNSKIETGNTGLISIAPIKLAPAPEYSDSQLFISATGSTTPPPPTSNAVVSGTLLAAGGTTTLVPSVTGDAGATCTRPTNTTFSCVIGPTATAPTLTIGNYYTKDLNLIACAPGLSYIGHNQGNNKNSTWTTYALPLNNTSGIAITIQIGTSCP